MLRLLADENFNNDIVRGIRRRAPEVDIVRVQDVDLGGVDDPTVLEWAARNRRALLTHEVSTITAFGYERTRESMRMPGVFEVSRRVSLRQAIEDLQLLATCSAPDE